MRILEGKLENLQNSWAYTDGDIDTNRSDNPTLASLVTERYSRRQTMMGGTTALTTAVFGSTLLAACGPEDFSPPVVSVGSTVTTSAGRVVTLAGTATDNGTVAGSAWTQTAGPSVELTTVSAGSVRFIAPAVASATDLRFRFTATDDKGQVGTTETIVTVMPATLGFNPVAKSLEDVVKIPDGYSMAVIYRLGDPLAAGVPAYANNGSDTDFARRAGDHHDALSFFGLAASGTARDPASNTRGLLVMNHENISEQYLHPNGVTSTGGVRPESEVIKEIEAHGVSVVEVSEGAGRAWAVNPSSALNRRITPNTPMVFNGPVRGNALLKTAYSTDGTRGRGTINNCANGYAPWGTYLTCEENWSGYFRRPAATDNPVRLAAGGINPKSVTSLARYGVTSSTGNYGWSTVTPANAADTIFARWIATASAAAPADGSGDWRNEPNHFGWVVEIDPYDPASTPRKRTALGRMGHEGAWPSRTGRGRAACFLHRATTRATNTSTSSFRQPTGTRLTPIALTVWRSATSTLIAARCWWRSSAATAPAPGCRWCTDRAR